MDDIKTLIIKSQEGDQAAFQEIMVTYKSRVHQMVFTMIDDESEAEDIVQETFFKAYMAIGNFRGDSDIFTWLYRIAVNNCKNRLLSKKRRMLRYGYDNQDMEDNEEENVPLLSGDSDPQEEHFANELHDLIYEAIEDLHPELREAITLRDLQGLSYQEISDIVGVAVGTVRSRIFRARESVNASIKPYIWRH